MADMSVNGSGEATTAPAAEGEWSGRHREHQLRTYVHAWRCVAAGPRSASAEERAGSKLGTTGSLHCR